MHFGKSLQAGPELKLFAAIETCLRFLQKRVGQDHKLYRALGIPAAGLVKATPALFRSEAKKRGRVPATCGID